MALALNKIVISGAVTNTASAYLQTSTLAATTLGTVIPAGVYLMYPTANVTVTANNGTSTSTLVANNTGGVVISDGVNVFALASTNTTVTLLTVNGGQSATGTFNV
jgi:hypothetical protein